MNKLRIVNGDLVTMWTEGATSCFNVRYYPSVFLARGTRVVMEETKWYLTEIGVQAPGIRSRNGANILVRRIALHDGMCRNGQVKDDE
jgi:hypothetical protein